MLHFSIMTQVLTLDSVEIIHFYRDYICKGPRNLWNAPECTGKKVGLIQSTRSVITQSH